MSANLTTVRALLTQWQITPTVDLARRLARTVGPLLDLVDRADAAHTVAQADNRRLRAQLRSFAGGRVGHRITTVKSRGRHVAACSCGDYMSEPYDSAGEAMEHGTDEHFAEIVPGLAQLGHLAAPSAGARP